jgi:putative FmdB family regulatory protein
MPTYEYRCTACRHQFEEFQSIKAAPLRTCPRCKKKTLERLIGTGGAVLFKGSGFYQTDYRSESYTKAAKQEAGEVNGSTRPADAPAAKADAAPAPAAKPEPAASTPAKAAPTRSSATKRRAGARR